MDHLTEIESIIQSQKWKKSKTTIQKSLSIRPLPPFKPASSSTSSLENLIKLDTNLPKNSTSQVPSPLRTGRIQELAKLAVPFKALKLAINQNIKVKPEETLVPAFPMRQFGLGNRYEPVFERLSPEYGSTRRKQEIQYIKRKSGRTSFNGIIRLPSVSLKFN